MPDDVIKEYRVGESTVLHRLGNLIHYRIVGNVDGDAAKDFVEIVEAIRREVPGKTNSLVDLTKAGKQTSEAREIGRKAFLNDRVGRVALFGAHPVARIIANFVIGRTGKKEMRFFRDEEEAASWLQENPE